MNVPQLRIARPVRELARAVRMYVDGAGLREIGRFEDHAGFDGVMLGLAGAGWHLEFTHCRRHPVAPAPTPEDLVVLYLPSAEAWLGRCQALLAAGFRQVPSFNPYWEQHGRTFEDADGYRLVLQNGEWPHGG